MPRMPLEQLARGVPDEPCGLPDAGHDIVARVRALRAVNALHLQPVTDVDARRTGEDTGPAVDAVASSLRPDLALHPWLTAVGVVRDDE